MRWTKRFLQDEQDCGNGDPGGQGSQPVIYFPVKYFCHGIKMQSDNQGDGRND
jgi:hypothetical protein